MDLVWLFGYQFLRYVEHLFHCEICVFDGMPIVWVILPMNTDAFNVEDINIHHITECFSLSSVTFIEDRFCLFRTWSFTLSKNDLDPDDKSNSVSSSPMMNCCVLAPLRGQRTGFTLLSGFLLPKWRACVHERKVIETRVTLPEGKQRVSPFYHPSIQQLSTLEKTKLCRRPTLSSVLSTSFQQKACGGALARDLCHGQQRVSPFYHISQLAYSEDFFFSPGFLMQKMTELREPLQSNSSLVLTLLWLSSSPDSSCVLFDITSEQSVELKWLIQTQQMIPLITCEISLG